MGDVTDTFSFTTVKPSAPFRPAVKTHLTRPSPGPVMPGSFDDAAGGDSDDDVAGSLLQKNPGGRTLSSKTSLASMTSSQGTSQGTSRSTSQQSQNGHGSFNFLNRPFGGGPPPRKGEAPKAVKSIQLAAAAAKKVRVLVCELGQR